MVVVATIQHRLSAGEWRGVEGRVVATVHRHRPEDDDGDFLL